MSILFELAAFTCLAMITSSVLRMARESSRSISEMALSVTDSLAEMQERIDYSHMMNEGEQFEEIYTIVEDIMKGEDQGGYDDEGEDVEDHQREWDLPEDWQRFGDN